jgi:hypothetical protein
VTTDTDIGTWVMPVPIERHHVFVVNGSPDFLTLARHLLQEEHYRVTTTSLSRAPSTRLRHSSRRSSSSTW